MEVSKTAYTTPMHCVNLISNAKSSKKTTNQFKNIQLFQFHTVLAYETMEYCIIQVHKNPANSLDI